jgi:hypothetical protein
MDETFINKDKCFCYTLYKCESCGYETRHDGNASRHKKSTTCKTPNMIKLQKTAMDIDDVFELIKNMGITPQTTIESQTINGNVGVVGVQNNITINLLTPTKNTRMMMMEAFKNPKLLAELKAASADEIPALIFRYTKGSESDGEYVKLDGDKVVEMDVNGKEKKLPTSKYIKKVIGDAVYTTKTHVNQIRTRDGYTPYEQSHVRMARLNVEDFNTAETPGYKKKEKVKVTDVLDKYSAGDHVVYKYPAETKKIIDDTVDNISNELNQVK